MLAREPSSRQHLSPNLSLFLDKLFHHINALETGCVTGWLVLGEHLECIKTPQSPFAFIFQRVKKKTKTFFILFLLRCFFVVVFYCFHLKWNHPNSVRTRKPNNSLRIGFAKEKAKPTGELGQLQGAQAAQHQPGLQTLKLGDLDRGLSHRK